MPILMPYNLKLAFNLPCLLLSAIAAHSLFKVGQKSPTFMLNSSLAESLRVEGLKVHYRMQLLLLIGLLLGSININAATCTVKNTGNWSDTNTWANCNSLVPSINDNVTMSNNKVVTLTANAAANSITFSSNSAQLSLFSNTLTVTGSITMTGGGTFNFNSGTLNVGGDFDSSNGNLSSGTGTINFNGNVAQNIGANTYNNVIINNSSGGVVLAGAVTVGGTLTLSSATLSVGSNTLFLL